MTTAGDGASAYEATGAGGNFGKKSSRRSIPATPYDRPHTAVKYSNPSMLRTLLDPASRLINAGANKLFDVFRNRLPPLSIQRPSGINEEPQNTPQDERLSDSSANMAAATRISELEQMLQEKTFTRSEVQRLTSLLHLRTTERTTESPSDESLEKHGDVRANYYAAISTPVIASKVIKETASPASLAKSYMGFRPTTLALRQDSKLIQRTPITPVAQKAANSLRDLEIGFVTPRSRGRSAMYTMAHTPYTRSPAFSQKGFRSICGHGAASTSSKSTFGHEEKMALKRSSSVLDDVIGSGGPLRSLRHKANVSSQRDKKELGYSVPQQDSQKLLLPNETESKVSGYASVPAKSTHTAYKILQHLENPSPKEKYDKYSVVRSMEKVDEPKFLRHDRFHVPIYGPKDKTEVNGPRKYPVPNNKLTSVSCDPTGCLKGKTPFVGFMNVASKIQEKPSQKERVFQMIAPDSSVKINDEIHDNEHVSFPFVENNKPDNCIADIIKTSPTPEMSQTHTLVESNNPVLREVAKVPQQVEVSEAENGFPGGPVSEQGLGLKIPISSQSNTATQTSVLPQITSQTEKDAPEKDSSSSAFVKTAENAVPVTFCANKPSELEPNSRSNSKANHSISVNGNGNDQNSTNIIGRLVSSFPAVPASGSFLFDTGTNNTSAPNITPASNPTICPSVAPFQAPASTSAAISTASTTMSPSATASTAAIFSTSVPPTAFGFESTSATAPTPSMAETANTSNATTTTTTSGTITSQSNGSFFHITNGSQTNTQGSLSSTISGPSAPAFGSSLSFSMGSLGPSSETKFGNSTCGPTTSILSSTWQQPQNSSGFSSTIISSPSTSVFTFGASPTPMPSFETGGATNSYFAGSPVFGAGATSLNNNNDQMSMEDGMAEDAMES